MKISYSAGAEKIVIQMYLFYFQNKVVDVEGTKVKLQVSILNIFFKFL